MILILCFIATGLQLIIFSSAYNSSHLLTLPLIQPGSVGSKKCMTDLGCFEITKDFFHVLNRPLNLLPLDRATIDTQFHLYNRQSPMEYHVIKHNDIDSIQEVDSTRQTIFTVHGFIDNKYYDKWMESMKDHLLLHDDYNVIIVDWSKGNGLPYTQATANTRVVGAEIALLINSLIKHKNLDPMKVHIIGHSLGSHIAGYAGQILKKLGRITALDPAAPYFQFMPPTIRLDPTDADFVDVIHTDSFSQLLLALGMHQECGHVDFYPNNGRNQPGCKGAAVHSLFLDGLIDASKRFSSCNHQRSIDFFLHSIHYKRALPVAFQCDSWSNFYDGKCADCSNGKCLIMGLKADKNKLYKSDSSVKMYLTTSAQKPFWQYTFQLTIKLKKPKSMSYDIEESINLKIEGSKNILDTAFSAKVLEKESTYTHLVRSMEPLGEINGMTFTWTNKVLNLLVKPLIHLEHIIIKPMNFDDEKEQMKLTKTFCNAGKKAIGTKGSAKLAIC